MASFDYERAVEQLEKIIKELENGSISLDYSVKLFTQGMDLLKNCNNYLNKTEEKLKILLDIDEDDINL